VGAARLALSLRPEDSVATYAIAVALIRLGAAEAEPWVRRAVRVSPKDPELSRWLEANR
jgi:hypothetical protein